MIASKLSNVQIDKVDVVGLGDAARRCEQVPGDSSDIAQYTKHCLYSEISTVSRSSPSAPLSADVVTALPSVDQLTQCCHDTAANFPSCELRMVPTSSDVLSSELQPMCSIAQRTKPAAPPTIEAADRTASALQQHDVVHEVVRDEHIKCPQQCVEELDDGHHLKACSTTGSLVSRQHSNAKQCSGAAAASMCDEKTVVASSSACQEAEHATSSGLAPQKAAAVPDVGAKQISSNPAMTQVQAARPTILAQGPLAAPTATASDSAFDTPRTTPAATIAPQHQDPPSSSPPAHGTPGVSPSAAATGEARDELSGETIAATRSGTAGSTGAEGNSLEEEATHAQLARQEKHRSKTGRVHSTGSSSMTCQIPGCGALLGSHTSSYFRRHRVCMVHAKADKVPMHGRDYRFCQQCGVLHPLEDFDGARKSCRVQLDKHNLRRRCRRKTQCKGSGPGGLDLPDDAEASGPGGALGASYDGVRYALTPVFWTGSPSQGPAGSNQVWGWGGVDEGPEAGGEGREAARFSEGGVVRVDAPHSQGRADWKYPSGASAGGGGRHVRVWQQGKQPGHRTSSSNGWQGGGLATSNGAAPSASTAARPGEWALPPHAAEDAAAAAGHGGEEASYAAALAAAAAAAGGLQGPGNDAAAAVAAAAAAAAATNRLPRSSNPSAAAWSSAASQQSRPPTLVATGGAGARMRGHLDSGMPQEPAMPGPFSKATAGLHHLHHSTAAPSEARRTGGQQHSFAAGRGSHSGEGEGDPRTGQAPLSLQQLRLYIAAAIAAGNGPGLTRIREAGFVQQLLLVDELAHGILHEVQQDVQQQRQQPDATTHCAQRQSGQEVPGQTWGHGVFDRSQPQAAANGGHHMTHDRAVDGAQPGRRAPQQQQQQQHQRPFSAASSSMAEHHTGARVGEHPQNSKQASAMDKAGPANLPEGHVPPVALMALMEQIAKYASPAAAAAGCSAQGPGSTSGAEHQQRPAPAAFRASLAHLSDAAAAHSLAQAGGSSAAALLPDNDGNSRLTHTSGYKRPPPSAQQSPTTKRPKPAVPEGSAYPPAGPSGPAVSSAHYTNSRAQVSAQRQPNVAAGVPYSNGTVPPPSSRPMDGAQRMQGDAVGMQGMAGREGQPSGRSMGLDKLARYAQHMKQEPTHASAAGTRGLEDQRQEQQQQHGGVDATAALTHLLQQLASVVDGQKGVS